MKGISISIHVISHRHLVFVLVHRKSSEVWRHVVPWAPPLFAFLIWDGNKVSMVHHIDPRSTGVKNVLMVAFMSRALMAPYWFKAVFIKFNLISGLHRADVPHSSRAGSWSIFWWRWFSIHMLTSLLCIDQLLFDLPYQKVTGSILWSFVEICSVFFV